MGLSFSCRDDSPMDYQSIARDREQHSAAPSSSAQSFYFINFSWNFISQQAGVCHPSAPLTMSPLPTFYLHFTTFSGCSAPHHLAEIPNLLSVDLPCLVASKIHSQSPKDLYTEPLWDNSWISRQLFCCCCGQILQKNDTLCSNAQLSWPVKWVFAYCLNTSQSPFLVDGRWIHFTLNCVLQFTLNGYQFSFCFQIGLR